MTPNARHKAWRDANRHKPEYKKTVLANATRHHQKLRRQVLEGYGGPNPKCACCGESEYFFLALDHINNDGAEKRRLYGGQKEEWRFLVKNNFPSGYQILCNNCNVGRKNNGNICPHQMRRENNG